MAVQFAKLQGANVIAISRNTNHLEIAKKLGASTTFTFNQDQEVVLNELKEKIGLLDAAIVFAPADIVTNTAIRAIKKGGLVVIATIGEISNFVAFEEKTIRGTLIGSRNDMKEVIKIADENNIKVVSEVYPLEEANEVLEKLKNSKIEARAVLVP